MDVMTNSMKMIALAALVLCSACTDKTATTTRITPTAQVVSIKWDEAVAAETTAKVGNTSLIFMR